MRCCPIEVNPAVRYAHLDRSANHVVLRANLGRVPQVRAGVRRSHERPPIRPPVLGAPKGGHLAQDRQGDEGRLGG